jgi:hypothetical protein
LKHKLSSLHIYYCFQIIVETKNFIIECFK